jgi:hypothetical protein
MDGRGLLITGTLIHNFRNELTPSHLLITSEYLGAGQYSNRLKFQRYARVMLLEPASFTKGFSRTGPQLLGRFYFVLTRERIRPVHCMYSR